MPETPNQPRAEVIAFRAGFFVCAMLGRDATRWGVTADD